MGNVFLIFVVVLFCACNKETFEEKPEQKGPLELAIDNETFNSYSSDIDAIINNAGKMIVCITYAKNLPRIYNLYFVFKENHLFYVSISYVRNGKNYQTCIYNTLKWFAIKNYQYNNETRNLSFDYEGKLYEWQSDISTVPKSITLKGKVNLKNIDKTDNEQRNGPKTTFSSNDFEFYSIFKKAQRSATNNPLFEHHFLTNNGYRLTFNISPEVVNTSNYPSFPRKYSFDTSSTENNITFYKFTGTTRTINENLFIIKEDWKKYNCKGHFIVNEAFHFGKDQIVKGIFNIEVFDGNNKIHTIKDGVFIL